MLIHPLDFLKKCGLFSLKAMLCVLPMAMPIFSNLVITEIHYYPLDMDSIPNTEFEFLELKNVGEDTLDLSNISFSKGIDYRFKSGDKLAPDSFLVLASNYEMFFKRYGFYPYDEYEGQLNNSGETLEITDDLTDETVLEMSFSSKGPWALGPAGTGPSLVALKSDSLFDGSNPENWKASSVFHGNPGKADVAADIMPILISEVLTHTDLPDVDAIELYNPNSEDVDIGGWFLSDQKSHPKKFRIPDSSIIASKGYLLFDENDFNAKPDSEENFALSAHGGKAFVFSADSSENLTGYVFGIEFGEIENGLSFGSYKISTGETHYTLLSELTLGAENSKPRVGPVVISEIMYNPADHGFDYLKIENISDEDVVLYDPDNPGNTWKVGGFGFEFPHNQKILKGGTVIIAGGSPSELDFRLHYNIGSGIPVYISDGKLSNGGETLTLKKPEEPYVDSSSMGSVVPYMEIDKVKYSDESPWPSDADGIGFSLIKLEKSSYGNDPANWVSGLPNPGKTDANTDSLNFKFGYLIGEMLPGLLNLFIEANEELDSIEAHITYENESHSIHFTPVGNSKTLFKSHLSDLGVGTHKLKLLSISTDGKRGVLVKNIERKL